MVLCWSNGAPVWALAAALSLAAPAAAQNRIGNGEFDDADQVDGWFQTRAWLPEDWEGAAGSGSLRVTNSIETLGGVYALQCIDVEPGEVLALSARVRVAPGQADGYAELAIHYLTEDGCTGSPTFVRDATPPAPETGEWALLETVSVVPPSGESGDVQLYNWKSVEFQSRRADFDAISVPEPDAAAGAGVVALVLAARAARRSAR